MRKDRRGAIKLLSALIAVIAIPACTSLIYMNSGEISSAIESAAEYAANNATLGKRGDNGLYNGSTLLYEENTEVEAPVTEKRKVPERVTMFFNNEVVTSEETEEATEPSEASVQLLIRRNISDISEDLSAFDGGSGEIYETTYHGNSGECYVTIGNGAQIRNCTDLLNDEILALAEQTPELTINTDGEPQVLIIHTHTSESYEPGNDQTFNTLYTSRTLDPTQSVVAVGERLAETLAENGIGVIHDGTVHDSPYSGAYDRSAETINAILEEYPSIKVILDIHRDAIEEYDGSRVAAVTEIGGKKAAQIMIISAADDGTYDIPNFRKNLTFASYIQSGVEKTYPGLMRPVLFQYCHYNQDISTGSLLIEVGSHGNSLDEALYSAELFGDELSKLLKALE